MIVTPVSPIASVHLLLPYPAQPVEGTGLREDSQSARKIARSVSQYTMTVFQIATDL